MLKFDHAVIMAAGRGMRMMPLTNVIPKAMAPFNGSTIIADGIKNIKDHIDNLYITGPSVFATPSHANPMLMITALALRLGDHLSKI